MIKTVKNFQFKTEDLRIGKRRSGISAHMRVKNGGDFLKQAIESHIEYFDEIVVVYNGCTDETEDILVKLKKKYRTRLKVYHYLEPIYSLGSKEHKMVNSYSVHSIATYNNFALSRTNYDIVTKLDDDHVAISKNLKPIIDDLRQNGMPEKVMYAFSGLNLVVKKGVEQSRMRIPAFDTISGAGDIGFFKPNKETYCIHTKKYERLLLPGFEKRYVGLLYWHLNIVKKAMAF